MEHSKLKEGPFSSEMASLETIRTEIGSFQAGRVFDEIFGKGYLGT